MRWCRSHKPKATRPSTYRTQRHSTACLLTRKVSWSPSPVIVRVFTFQRDTESDTLLSPRPRMQLRRVSRQTTFGDLGTRWLSLYAGYKGDIREGGEEMG